MKHSISGEVFGSNAEEVEAAATVWASAYATENRSVTVESISAEPYTRKGSGEVMTWVGMVSAAVEDTRF